jgi:serine phosphatase RsbU (regulator of sigma subunit)
MLVAQVKDKARLESEIQIAAQMQQDMCPRVVPKVAGCDLAGTMVPAKEVGGDYYDYIEDQGLLAIVVGDVSGKGLGSGIVAVMARSFLRSMVPAYGLESPSTLLQYLNMVLSKELKPGMFMTMLLLVWDPAKKVARYASAGHEHIVVWRAKTKAPESIKSGGTPLGISADKGGPTADAQLTLAPGDALVLYSDGVTEAMNEKNDEFEMPRLLESVKKNATKNAAGLVEAITNDVAAHVGKADQSDDITMVVLRRTS